MLADGWTADSGEGCWTIDVLVVGRTSYPLSACMCMCFHVVYAFTMAVTACITYILV